MKLNKQILNAFQDEFLKEIKISNLQDVPFFKCGGKTIQLSKKGSKNKIHIKESRKGSFTKYCNGKVTEECIRKGKNSPNPAIRKKATFAANARKWNH